MRDKRENKSISEKPTLVVEDENSNFFNMKSEHLIRSFKEEQVNFNGKDGGRSSQKKDEGASGRYIKSSDNLTSDKVIVRKASFNLFSQIFLLIA